MALNNTYMYEGSSNLREDGSNYFLVNANQSTYYLNDNVPNNHVNEYIYKVYLDLIMRTNKGDFFKFNGRCTNISGRKEVELPKQVADRIIDKLSEAFTKVTSIPQFPTSSRSLSSRCRCIVQ